MHLKKINFRTFLNSVFGIRSYTTFKIDWKLVFTTRIQDSEWVVVHITTILCWCHFDACLPSGHIIFLLTKRNNREHNFSRGTNESKKRWEMFPIYMRWAKTEGNGKTTVRQEETQMKSFLCVWMHICSPWSSMRHKLFKELTRFWIRLRYDDIRLKIWFAWMVLANVMRH